MTIEALLNDLTSSFSELRTVRRQLQFDLKSIYGLSLLRNRITTANGGTVTATVGDPEIVLATTTNVASRAVLDSRQRGRYIASFAGEAGIGIRIVTPPTGDGEIRWGYFDDNDGYFFLLTSTGLSIGVRKNAADTLVAQSNFSIDTADRLKPGFGDGINGIDTSKGIIYGLDALWYGNGGGLFYYVDESRKQAGQLGRVFLHLERPTDGTPSLNNPNLPIRCEIDNNGEATALEARVTGRAFTLVGDYDPSVRSTAEEALGVASIGTTRVPLMSFRLAPGYQTVSATLAALELSVDGTAIVEAWIDGTLTSPTWGLPSGATSGETGLQSDTSATAVSGGILIYKGLVSASGTGSNASGEENAKGLNFDLVGDDTVLTVTVRAVAGTITASLITRINEEF